MGICYSEQQEWEAYHREIREKRRNRKKKKNASIIYQENSIYQNSFASKVEDSFREDIYESIENMAGQSGSLLTGGSSIAIGSIVEMNQQELRIVHESLSKIHPNGELHNINDPVTLCSLKTKNFLHTHKVSYPNLPKLHEVSCCPYNANHIIEYDIWKFVKCQPEYQQSQIDSETNESHHQNQEFYYIYHPFTQRFLNVKKDHVVCTEQKKQWRIISFGPRRKGGFVKIVCEEGQLCMTDQRGLLTNHRKLGICSSNHISHLWQLRFGQIM